MKRYRVGVFATRSWYTTVEAETEEEAERKAEAELDIPDEVLEVCRVHVTAVEVPNRAQTG